MFSAANARTKTCDTGDALICCIVQFAHPWLGNLLVAIHVGCKFQNQSAPLNFEAVFGIYDRITAVLGVHCNPKVQQCQLDVAAFLHRLLHEVLRRPNGSFNLPIALRLSRTACDVLEVPSLRELSELAARELWTIVRHEYYGHSMTRKLSPHCIDHTLRLRTRS